jgi:transposase
MSKKKDKQLQGDAAVDAIFDQAVAGDPIQALVNEFNAKFMVVKEEGKALIYEPTFDRRTRRRIYNRLSVNDLKLLYQNRKVKVTAPNGDTATYPAAGLWLGHEDRRQYLGGVVFDPTGNVPADTLNLWEGFAVEPKAGDWSLLKEHMLTVLCAGNQRYFDYLMGWLAYMIQHPDEQGKVAVILCGIEGCGKGIFAHAVKNLFGQHGLYISNAKHLVGNFNIHLRDTVLLFADEAFFAGDKAHTGVLKSLVTEEFLTVEGKFRDVVQSPNYLHILMASNERWVVPAGLEARRFFVLNVLPDRKGDFAYFNAILQQLKNGGYEAMLQDLLDYDLTEFNVADVPQTEGLGEQKKLTFNTEQAWWMDVLQRGHVFDPQHDHTSLMKWMEKVSTSLLFASYELFAKKVGERHPLSREAFGKFMVITGARPGRLTDAIVKETPASVIKAARPPGYHLGTLKNARTAFLKATKLHVEWNDDAADTADEADSWAAFCDMVGPDWFDIPGPPPRTEDPASQFRGEPRQGARP